MYQKLNIEQSANHIQQVCCTRNLFDKEIFMLNEAFSVRSSLSETEQSTLDYISGYVAFEENIAILEPTGTIIFQAQNLLF